MACLLLEAVGYAARGQGWRLAAEGDIKLKGRIPISTLGGLKARGHPIGATGGSQIRTIVLQLRGEAGSMQVAGNPDIGLVHNIGGVGLYGNVTIFGRG